MSLQSIIDATPVISWGEKNFGEYVGSSHKRSYLLGNDPVGYIVYWYKFGDKLDRYTASSPQLIIDKINELEGIK